MRKSIFIITLLFLLTGCLLIEDDVSPEPESVGIANPASVYCIENGGELDIRESDTGQYGVCVFDDGSECEEWAFYRGECQSVGITADDLTEMTPDECIAKGGRTLNIVGGFTCDEDEETIGKVVGFISPNVCCRKSQAEDITEEIEAAFLKKYSDWQEYDMEIIVSEVDGDYASGGSRPRNADAGGGYFFAAKTDEGWVIAADGNGNIFCSEIEPYNFPSDMIPECWDDVNMVNIER